MTLNQQKRALEKIPQENFSEYVKTLNLPYQQFFFADKDDLALITSKHQEILTHLHQKSQKYKTMIELIRNSSHIVLFGTHPTE